jgi:hypothetical protein
VRRLLRLGVVLAVLGAAGVLAGCSGGAESSVTDGEPISFEQLSEAAASSADVNTGVFAFSFEASMQGTEETFAFRGEGAFDAAAEQARFSFDLASLAKLLGEFFGGYPVSGWPDFDDPSAWRLEAIQDGNSSYVRFPALASELPAGKSWVRAETASELKVQGLDFTQFKQFGREDRRKLLDHLRAASGEIETVGMEELRGVSTTHYRATVDLAEYAKLAPPSERSDSGSFLGDTLPAGGAEAPVDFWLDEEGLVRKLEMSFAATQPGTTEETTASLTFELWGYGEPVEVELPPPAQVVDASALD